MKGVSSKSISGKVDSFLKWSLYVLIFMALVIWATHTFRILPIIFALMAIPALVYWRLYRRDIIKITFVVIFIALTVMPFDITFRNVPGGPKIVRYVFGLPGDGELLRAAKRGELVLGGCVRMGRTPRWILVW